MRSDVNGCCFENEDTMLRAVDESFITVKHCYHGTWGKNDIFSPRCGLGDQVDFLIITEFENFIVYFLQVVT